MQGTQSYAYWKKPWAKWCLLAAGLLQLLALWMSLSDYWEVSSIWNHIMSEDAWKSYVSQTILSCSVKALAAAFGYSERTLGDIFHANVGTSVKRYINDLRVNEAAQLLMKTDKGVEQIGYAVGFESFRTFLRAFKDKTGLTPSVYRGDVSQHK